MGIELIAGSDYFTFLPYNKIISAAEISFLNHSAIFFPSQQWKTIQTSKTFNSHDKLFCRTMKEITDFLCFTNRSQRLHVSIVFFCWLEWIVTDRRQTQIFWRGKQKSERQQRHLPLCLISALHSVPEMHTSHRDRNIFIQLLA